MYFERYWFIFHFITYKNCKKIKSINKKTNSEKSFEICYFFYIETISWVFLCFNSFVDEQIKFKLLIMKKSNNLNNENFHDFKITHKIDAEIKIFSLWNLKSKPK
jgi:hypothetical protein